MRCNRKSTYASVNSQHEKNNASSAVHKKIHFLPSPPKWLTWPLDVCRGVLYGWFYWFSLHWKKFFPKPLWRCIHNGVRFFFSAFYVMCDIFFSAGYFSPSNLFACIFSLVISLQDIFSQITHNPPPPPKVKWSAPKIQQTFGHLTDSDLPIISKGFWNNRGQNSLGEKGGIRFYLTLPGKFVRWRHKLIFSDR